MQGAEDELKDAVAKVRPVSVAFQVVKEFRFYKSGVFTSETCGNTPMVSFNDPRLTHLVKVLINYFTKQIDIIFMSPMFSHCEDKKRFCWS